jgi:transcription initiation factor TFIIIB Brf1 subunit/transcription initiation factor TFIIB
METECPNGYQPYDGACPSCGSTFIGYEKRNMHMEVICLSCGRFIKHTPHYDMDTWKREIKQRDNFVCQRCGYVGTSNQVQAHHKMPVWFMPKLQYDTDNGITLCKQCHKQLHGADGTIKDKEE